jgi:ABC-type nitrate/sulfonate/bicarbonate transport system substrate-binding protein
LTALGADGHVLQPKMEFRDRVFLQMNRSWVLANREATVGMLRALVQASRFLKSNPQEGYAIVAKQLSLTPQQVQDQIGQGWEYDVTLGQDAVDEAVSVAKFMVDRGMLKQAVDARGLFDPSLLKTVDPALVTVR